MDEKLVPESFCRSPFYEQGSVIKKGEDDRCFYYDLAFLFQWDEKKPWEEKSETIVHYFAEWKSLKEKLAQCYAERNRKKARPFMIKAIANFIDILFWTNGARVACLFSIVEDISCFRYKPINMEERISYIMEEIDHFHVFNQLKALYEEMEKIYYVSKIGKD